MVLLADAVVVACGDIRRLEGFAGKIMALSADAEARGVGEVAAAIGLSKVDDAGLVGMIVAHDHCLTWR